MYSSSRVWEYATLYGLPSRFQDFGYIEKFPRFSASSLDNADT